MLVGSPEEEGSSDGVGLLVRVRSPERVGPYLVKWEMDTPTF